MILPSGAFEIVPGRSNGYFAVYAVCDHVLQDGDDVFIFLGGLVCALAMFCKDGRLGSW
jgi:hypothetical protein